MTIHISARLAWHMDGWNGRICRKPACNVFCVGPHSYPGEMIAEKRNSYIPSCIYSANAFGDKALTAFSDLPDSLFGGAKRFCHAQAPANTCAQSERS